MVRNQNRENGSVMVLIFFTELVLVRFQKNQLYVGMAIWNRIFGSEPNGSVMVPNFLTELVLVRL